MQPNLFQADVHGGLRPAFAEPVREATIQERFLTFHAEHPEVYGWLVALARQWKAAGKTKCGIRMLWERMRWELSIGKADGDDFACNDHMHSRYVRLIVAKEPDLAGMFELRELKAE